jgi:hypothetical protein
MSGSPGRLRQLWDRALHPGGEPAVVGSYASLEQCLQAVRGLRQAGLDRLQVYSPVPAHELEEALEPGPGVIRYFTLLGGILGGGGGFLLASWTSLQGGLITGGKPMISVPPFLVITFECAILVAGLFTLLGFLLSSRLPQPFLSPSYRERFGEDRFGVGVICGEFELRQAEETLKQAGAEEVFRVRA